MIPYKLHIKVLALSTFFIVCCSPDINSQGIDIYSGWQKRAFIGMNLNPSVTTITNKEIASIYGNSSTGLNSFSGSLETGIMFSRYFGIVTGVGYKSYTSDISLSSFNISYDTIDSENDYYKRYVSGNDITENQKISFLSVPIAVNIQIPFSKTIGLSMQSGVNMLFSMNSSYSSSGSFTYEGYYSKYNVRVSDIPFEGFEAGYKNQTEGDLKIKSFNYDFFASGGLYLNIKKKLQLSFGAIYSKILSDISDYEPSSSFRLSSMPDNLNSMMAGSAKVTAQSIGINFGLRYFLK
jgi:hypothetical protein